MWAGAQRERVELQLTLADRSLLPCVQMASFLQLGLHLPPFEQLPSMSPYDGLDKHLVTPAVNPHPFPGDGTDMLGPKGSNGGLSHGCKLVHEVHRSTVYSLYSCWAVDSSNLPSASSLLPFRTKYGAPRSAPPSPSTSATSTSKLIGQQPPKDPTRMHEMGFTPASALPPVTALMGSVHIRHPPLQSKTYKDIARQLLTTFSLFFFLFFLWFASLLLAFFLFPRT